MVGAPNEIETRASGFFIKFFNSCTVCSRRFDTHTHTDETKRNHTPLSSFHPHIQPTRVIHSKSTTLRHCDAFAVLTSNTRLR